MLIYLALLIGIVAWKFIPRPWKPSITLETAHYTIYSTATQQQTEATGSRMELLYAAYSNRFAHLPTFQVEHPKLKVKLYKDRQEFRRINPHLGWAEAFYRKPYCAAYFAREEMNPYHWMLHEGVHQLNAEVAHLKLKKWLEEGLAQYFSTSLLTSDNLQVGRIDPNTYPVWWIEELATMDDLAENIRNRSVIPLRAIVTNRGGPGQRRYFNLYYLHWWTLTHFLFESPHYRAKALDLLQRGGDLKPFEECLGPVEQLQIEWHGHVLTLKQKLSRAHLEGLDNQKPR